MRIGYARISTDDQNLHLQHDALAKAGCKKVFDDRISGAKALRPGLVAARARGRRGGRPKALDERKRALAVQLYHERNLDGTTKRTVKDICSLLGISKSTFYSYLSDAAP